MDLMAADGKAYGDGVKESHNQVGLLQAQSFKTLTSSLCTLMRMSVTIQKSHAASQSP
jgi:hypothetical protein